MLNKGLKPVLYDKDKAVSPIIATILLVAITVILASTLYLALGGFFSHTTTVAPTATVSVTNTTGSSGTPFSYSISVGSPTSAVSLSNVILKVTYSNGKTYSSGPLSTATFIGTVTGADNYSLSVSPTTGDIGPGTTITITSQTATPPNGVTSIQVVDTGTNGGVLGTASVS